MTMAPHTVNEVLHRLRWEPEINLCLLTVEGTNAFCPHNEGLDRVAMPQLSGIPRPNSFAAHAPMRDDGNVDLSDTFLAELVHNGVNVRSTHLLVSDLTPTQDQLVTGKVWDLVDSMVNEGIRTDSWTFVSNDNHILDGHHRWAAETVYGFLHFDPKMLIQARQVDMPICDLVPLAEDFMNRMGITPEGA